MEIINGFNLKNIRGDILGGITAAVVALPLALAFGNAAFPKASASGNATTAAVIPPKMSPLIFLRLNPLIISKDNLLN